MKDINDVCRLMRLDCLVMAEAAGVSGMHFGGTFSMIEIVAALYLKKMKVSRGYFHNEDRDRVIISKGHGVPAVYAALHYAGIVSDEDLSEFKGDSKLLSGHPSINSEIGMEFSTGSLGQGLSQGVGTAIGLHHKGNNISKVYVILGDGECDEGAIWEAAMSATKYKLNNLVAVIDNNHLQYDGDTETVMPLCSLSDKWKSFGWNVVNINGHDTDECYKAFDGSYDRPTVVIADTVKGKGVSFMEDDYTWHHKQITKKQLNQALEELGADDRILKR